MARRLLYLYFFKQSEAQDLGKRGMVLQTRGRDGTEKSLFFQSEKRDLKQRNPEFFYLQRGKHPLSSAHETDGFDVQSKKFLGPGFPPRKSSGHLLQKNVLGFRHGGQPADHDLYFGN